MPCDNATVFCWFTKKLIVPEADGAPQQLTGDARDRGIPNEVMESRSQSPRSQRVEQCGARDAGFVGMILVPEFIARVVGNQEFVQLAPQGLQLICCQHANPFYETVPLEGFKLFRIQRTGLRACKQVADRLMKGG